MSQSQHLSADLIADLLEGSLSAAETMSANAHLSECDDCAALRDAVQDVSVVLAEEAATVWSMPADVVASLDAAIARASLERASGVVSLDSVRRPRERRTLRWLAGAAAAVAVAGIGVAGWQAIGPQNATNSASEQPSNSSIAPHRTLKSTPGVGPGVATTPVIVNGNGRRVYPVSPAQVPQRALWLAMHPDRRVAPSAEDCGDPIGGISTIVLWQGRFAVLDIFPATRTATILDCSTAVHSIYTTGY